MMWASQRRCREIASNLFSNKFVRADARGGVSLRPVAETFCRRFRPPALLGKLHATGGGRAAARTTMTLKFSSKNLRQRRQALNIGVPAQERSRWAGGRGGEGLQAAARVGVSGTKLHRAKWRNGAETVQKRCGFAFSMGPARSGPPWPHRPRPECRWCAPLWVCPHRADPNATPPTGLTPQLSRFFRRTLRWAKKGVCGLDFRFCFWETKFILFDAAPSLPEIAISKPYYENKKYMGGATGGGSGHDRFGAGHLAGL